MAKALCLRTVAFAMLLVFGQGCSWSVRFYVLNNGPAAKTVVIEVEKPSSGFVIFDPAQFALLPLDEAEPQYGKTVRVGRATQQSTVEIPPHSALEIGHLNNDRYDNSKQQFINGRVFNLKKITSGTNVVTRENFDSYFKKKGYGISWDLP